MWRTLAQKLSTPGSNITMVTYGGSVTAGHLSGSPDGSWVEHLTAWLQTAFPDVTFNVLNLARNSTDNVAAATCWAQYAPADADLVVVEYSVNNCNYNTCTGITQQLVYSYELLLRRLMLRAPNAALMALAAFRFSDFAGVDPSTGSQVIVPNPFFNAGEDVHAGIARRYGVPMMSVRDTLHDLMWDDAGESSIAAL
ncbi:hypothetical protein OEZ85_001758 [Tetradesmus obliquus]|uniref:SGNH hydrolase-type esterase domain-containing protein n=1 Tax=Tetradesmus obliquus TaxID=3088 RepID=A0ABY8U0Y6_TETOB|nr:hypothetical protein OEZ85_001758 [Tetradesmus obliquus]